MASVEEILTFLSCTLLLLTAIVLIYMPSPATAQVWLTAHGRKTASTVIHYSTGTRAFQQCQIGDF